MHTSEVFVNTAHPSLQDQFFEIAYMLDFGRIGVVIFFPESVRPAPGSTSNPLTCMAI
jgi:hypothetical protein